MYSDLRSDDWLGLLALGMRLCYRPNLMLTGGTFWYSDYEPFHDDLRRLRRNKVIESAGEAGAKRAIGLSERFKTDPHLTPDLAWDRSWDGKWRVVLFDLKLEEHSLRNTLWRWLRARRFGLLQRSAWISPDPIGSMPKSLQQLRPGSRGFHVLETDSISGQAPAEAAEHCWDFAAVNKLYGQVLAVHDRGFELAGNPAAKPEAKRRWLAQERVAWQAAIFADPLLPRSMHPPGYLGPRAFARRQEVFAAMAGPMAD